MPMSSTPGIDAVRRPFGAVAARILSIVAWIGAHSIYGVLLLLYRVDRRLLIGGLIALPLLVIALVWATRQWS